jgi:hypothetical protein
MAHKSKDRPARAREIVSRTLARFGLDDRVRAHGAFQIWKEAVGPQVAGHARPERISNRVLRVRVDHNTWLQQLHFMKTLILERLNERLGAGTFIDIELRIGNLPPQVPENPNPAPSESLPPTLTADDAAQIDKEIERVSDPGLREVLKRIRIKGTRSA